MLTLALLASVGSVGMGPQISRRGDTTLLQLGRQNPFHVTKAQVSDWREIRFGDSGTRVITWKERSGRGQTTCMYAVSLNGTDVDVVRPSATHIRLKYAEFDPLHSEPSVPTGWQLAPHADSYLVQFATQPLDEYRDALLRLGATIYNYIPDNAYIVRMDDETKERVEALPYVRWVGRFEPAYRLDPKLLQEFRTGQVERGQFIVQVIGDDPALKGEVASRLSLLGVGLDDAPPTGSLMLVTMTPEQLHAATHIDGLAYVDRAGKPETDMDNVRTVSGASYIEFLGGYKGQGVNAHIIDSGVRATHQALAGRLAVRTNSGDTSHGTSTSGIVTGNGAGNAAGTGMLPLGNLVFSVYTLNWSTASRLSWTQSTVDHYQCVIESNSWGDTLTGQYTTISSGMDEIIFKTDLLICQSMSNFGNNTSVRPQAWAKNIVAVGGVNHFNDTNVTNDRWQNTASIGPAADGRIKPEFAFYYDSILCPTNTSDTAYTTGFGGTSAATPMTAGSFGLLYQLWGDGVFGNHALNNSVFANRPKSTTAKAIMINQANQYNNNGSLPYFDISRYVQGWGLPNLQNVYTNANSMFIVNETDVLTNLKTKRYKVYVPPGSPALKATMVYMDPWAPANSNPTLINNLDLRVISPTDVLYHGNRGMITSAWTTSGGIPDARNTAENVFIQNPMSGIWTIEVRASSVVQDARPETPSINDVDFALVVSGVAMTNLASNLVIDKGTNVSGTYAATFTSNNVYSVINSTLTPPYQVQVTIPTTLPTNLLQYATLTVESRSDVSGGNLQLELYNFGTNGWETISGNWPIVFTDSAATFLIKNPKRYMDASRNAQVRLTWTHPTTGPMQVSIDHVRWWNWFGLPQLP